MKRTHEKLRSLGIKCPVFSDLDEALRSVGRELMRNHLKHCATSAIKSSSAEADAMYDELVDMMFKHSR